MHHRQAVGRPDARITHHHSTEPPGVPSLLEELVDRALNPLVLADATDPDLPVKVANQAARAHSTHDGASLRLSDWIGVLHATEILAGVKAGESHGTAGQWRWQLTTMDAGRWLVCDYPPHSQDPSGASDPGENRDLIRAYEASLAVGSDLALETVLQRIVDLARQVVPARYAALGIADEQGRILQFITSGISPEERAAIGPLPEGHGLLGELITEGRPLLVADIAADPRSSGFPPNHPPMTTLLGVPITLGDRVLGDLYLTEREGGTKFTQHDLDAVSVLAGHAASAIDRAKLHADLRSAHQRAEEQRDRLRTILDNLPSAILIVTPPDGAVELANAAAQRLIFGQTPPGQAQLRHLGDFRLFEAEGMPLAHDLRPGVRALRNLTVRNQQLLLERRDGERIPVLTQATPLHGTQGSVSSAVIVFQDITRLREAEQLKDDFLALISHEFRTPLTAIQGGAQLLASQRVDLDEETLDGLLADIAVESERLDRMLRNMLSLAAIMAGRLTASTEPVLLQPLIRAAMDEVARRSPNHTFISDLQADLPPIEADPDLLSQVLRNLYENAVKYAPSGGEIRTSSARDDANVTLYVTDQGTGIAPEHVPHVFERFRRPGADPTVRGMGLGLYLSRHLVEAQGGTIGVQSAGPGQGATFWVRLPIARGWDSDSEQ